MGWLIKGWGEPAAPCHSDRVRGGVGAKMWLASFGSFLSVGFFRTLQLARL